MVGGLAQAEMAQAAVPPRLPLDIGWSRMDLFGRPARGSGPRRRCRWKPAGAIAGACGDHRHPWGAHWRRLRPRRAGYHGRWYESGWHMEHVVAKL